MLSIEPGNQNVFNDQTGWTFQTKKFISLVIFFGFYLLHKLDYIDMNT